MTHDYKLINDENWQIDHALHEFAVVRGDLSSLMQPRVRLPKVPPLHTPRAGLVVGSSRLTPTPPVAKKVRCRKNKLLSFGCLNWV